MHPSRPMSAEAANATPALLIFGPQTNLSPNENLETLRAELLYSPLLVDLRKTVADLPDFWNLLVASDRNLRSSSGRLALERLRDWLYHGRSSSNILDATSPLPNSCALPLTILLQIAQYVRYLRWLDSPNSHELLVNSCISGSCHGFCVGLLSAVAVAGAANARSIATLASISLKIAVGIGSYVDLDGHPLESENQFSSLSARWKDDTLGLGVSMESIVQKFQDAYISSITDDNCVTVTVRSADLSGLTKQLQDTGVRTVSVPVTGRYHSAHHSDVVERLLNFFEAVSVTQAWPQELPKAMCGCLNNELTPGRTLLRDVLETILVFQADWNKTIKTTMAKVGTTKPLVIFSGFGRHLPPTTIQEHDLKVFSLSSLDTAPLTDSIRGGFDYPSHSIAIVGTAGRFPGANSPDELWDILITGGVTVEPAPLKKFHLPSTGDYNGKQWWGNFLQDSDAFDHKFFQKSSREALAWDPQQRLMLEVVYEALESSMYFGAGKEKASSEDYGCYIGAVTNNYYDNISCYPPTAYGVVGTSRCYLSGIVSHHFGWTGPSLTIDTACSSSLVAIHTACRAIWSGECSRAIAGGTNVFSSPFDYMNLDAAGFLSPSGQCKPFDSMADGYCRSEAVAAVVLAPLSDALTRGDEILGVITGSFANQNQNISHVTVPHSQSQVRLYRKIMELSAIQPGAVSYVEAHGTGTGVGDPVEVRSIREGFAGPWRETPLIFSSVKGSIGHTEASAGIVGLVKTLLMMRHSCIPPQASYQSLNPKIPPLGPDKMDIPTAITPWNTPFKIACVNSYGAAGSNAALIIAQPPKKAVVSHTSLSEYPIVITAGSSNSLKMYCQALKDWIIGKETVVTTADLAFTLANHANFSLPHIIATTISNAQDVQNSLQFAGKSKYAEHRSPVILVLGGQETDFIGLSQPMYRSATIFRHYLDLCDKTLVSLGHESLFPSIFEDHVKSLVTLHVGLFAVQYSSAKAWMDCGLVISALIGHSLGQLTALCLSGSLDLPDAIKLIAGRAKIMLHHWGEEPGAMMFVQADIRKIRQILTDVQVRSSKNVCEIACYNGRKSHVIVGTAQCIDEVRKYIAEENDPLDSIRTKKLNIKFGFHSRFTEPLLGHLTTLAHSLEWKHPTLHVEFCNEFRRSTDPDASVVAEHTRRPVFFQSAVRRLAQHFGTCTWLEAGRGSSVLQLARQSVPEVKGHTFLSPDMTSAKAQSSLAIVTVELWRLSHSVQFWLFHRSQSSQFSYLHLPTHRFEKTRHWLEFTGRKAESNKSVAETKANEATPELLSFLNFVDHGSTRKALFSISPNSERFQILLAGHIMSGQSLAPASLYFEVAACAAMQLVPDLEAMDFVPTVESLVMMSPIGCSVNQKIVLAMTSVADDKLAWVFTITSHSLPADERHTTKDCGQAKGIVRLSRRDDLTIEQYFRRFEPLASFRYNEIRDHPSAQRMSGKHIYRAFDRIVRYGRQYQGMKEVACLGMEAAGKVTILPNLSVPVHQRLYDTPLIDSFMQFAGILVNYFNNPSLDDLFVCHKIDHLRFGNRFSPDAKEWRVYSTMSESANESGQASADVYILEAESGKMVMAGFGFHFSRVTPALLAAILKGEDQSSVAASIKGENKTDALLESKPTKISESKRDEFFQILHSVTDIPLSEVTEDCSLDSLGVDSLGATELLNDIRMSLGITIDLSSFLMFPNIKAIVECIDQKLGIHTVPSTGASISEFEVETGTPPSKTATEGINQTATIEPVAKTVEPGFIMCSAFDLFESMKYNYCGQASVISVEGYWSDAHPGQARLVRAYVLEAFLEVGCDIRCVISGTPIPLFHALTRHERLVRQLYRILEDGGLVESKDGTLFRTAHQLDQTPAEAIYRELRGQHTQHDNVNELIKVAGEQLADYLKGEKDGLQILWANKDNKARLEDFYKSWPLLQLPVVLLGDFLRRAYADSQGAGKLKILEVGAGTGGTTRYIVDLLRSHGIPFEYTFTDISSSLVVAAKKIFQHIPEMAFDVLDIECPATPERYHAYHCIIATNCVHATRQLNVSLKNLRSMVRSDGALMLIEATENLFWFDVVFGLFDGWWAYEDGRSHALVNEKHWERELKASGFDAVSWSEGNMPEAATVRLIAAFPTIPLKQIPEADMHTLVYKTIDGLKLHADIYFPKFTPRKKLPIALMIHGGSHIVFSRKDIRPAQTRLLLEKGYLPVSLDYRLCPEVKLAQGAMVDVRDALTWARNHLPAWLKENFDINADGDRVVAVGWSSGGQLAMSLGWTAQQAHTKPPEAILALYCPTDYEDEWWTKPNQPNGAPDNGLEYDVLEGVEDEALSNYGIVGAWEALSDSRMQTDARCRIVLHLNWKAQTLPVIIGGLPSKAKACEQESIDWNDLPQPPLLEIIATSPRAQIERGNFQTPTFLIHGTKDDLIPWQQTDATYRVLKKQGVPTELALVEGAPHVCDLSSDSMGEGWKAVLKGYAFLDNFV